MGRRALCFAPLPAPVSIPMETKQAVPDQQQSLNFISTLWCADQTPQYSYSLMISCDFYQQNAGWKEPFCLPAMESRRAPRLPACRIICVCLFIMHSFRFFSPAVPDAAIWDRNSNSLYGLYPVHEAREGEKKLGTDAILRSPTFSSSYVNTVPKSSCFNKNSKLTTSYILPAISFTSLTLKSLGMVIIIYRLCIRKQTQRC